MFKITLVGSARFEKEFHQWSEKLTLAGIVPYSLSIFPSQKQDQHEWYTTDQKETLDLIHLTKILESDAIAVLNVEGYIGDSTKREIKWARIQGKTIWWLEPPSRARRKNAKGEQVFPYLGYEGNLLELIKDYSERMPSDG